MDWSVPWAPHAAIRLQLRRHAALNQSKGMWKPDDIAKYKGADEDNPVSLSWTILDCTSIGLVSGSSRIGTLTPLCRSSALIILFGVILPILLVLQGFLDKA